MTAPTTASRPRSLFANRGRCEILFLAASLIWAAVIVDTGDIAWPLAMWMATALGPLSLCRRRTAAGRHAIPVDRRR